MSTSVALEILQIKHSPSREIVTDIFTQGTQEYSFRKNRDCRIHSMDTVFHGSWFYQFPENWEVVPVNSFL